MIFRTATEEDRARFNDFVARFDTGDLLQSFEWGDLKAKGGWKPVRVYAEENGDIVAAASMLKRNIPKVGKCIIYAPRGPVMDTSNRELVEAFVGYMKQVAREHGAILIKIDPPVPVEDTVSEENLRLAGFKPVQQSRFGGTQPKAVMQLDLAGRNLDEIMSSFKEKWRYNIRLAARKGVTVKMDCDKDDLETFYNLLKETAKRDQFLVRGFDYYKDMWDILVPAGFMKLVLVHYENEAIAGAIDYIFGDKAMYTYGASSNEHRNVMPNHLMQWELIKWAKEQGCKWYDFRGVSPRRNGDEKLTGLNRFKAGFNARYVEYIGEYDMVLSPMWYKLWNLAMRIQDYRRSKNRAAQSQTGGVGGGD